MGQRLFIGKGCVDNLSAILKEYAPKTLLLVRGKESYAGCGAQGLIEPILSEAGIVVTLFSDFRGNPQIEDAYRGITLLGEHPCDLILAVGGGSVIDMAKLIRFFDSYEGSIDVAEFVQVKESLPLIVVPTTAGTGSEATRFAVVYRDHVKYSVDHPAILPEVAIVDPVFTYHADSYLTACTGFDALAQAIEAFWSVKATAESDDYAEKAIQLLWKALPEVIQTELESARNALSLGAFYAGKAINTTRTTAPHAFSYPFTSYYGLPHGHAVAMTFPFFLEFNYVDEPSQLNASRTLDEHHQKMNLLYRWLGISSKGNASEVMNRFLTSIGLFRKLPDDFDKNLIIENINLQRLGNNPRLLTREDIALPFAHWL